MRRVRSVLVALLALGFAFAPPHGPTAEKTGSPDEQLLAEAGLRTDGLSLLAFFRTRAKPEGTRDELQALVDRLVDDSAEKRAQATADLIARGPTAIPALRRAINDLGDRILTERARKCLQSIEGPGGAGLVGAAARVLAVRKPEGTTEALLTFLPYADDQAAVDEVRSVIVGLAATATPDPAIVKALDDPLALRRACAGAALCRSEYAETRRLGARLLKDPNRLVRMWAALALVERQEVVAVPVLIDLLGELPAAERGVAEDGLRQLAGEWAPNLNLPEDDVSRRIRRDAWDSWWRNTDGPALIREFRQRTLTETDRTKLHALVKQLGDDNFDVREKAAADVAAYGVRALPLLRTAAADGDVERAQRVNECIEKIEQNKGTDLPSVAPKLLLMRRPPGAVAVLLDFLPFAESEGLADEARSVLGQLAIHDGTADPVLIKALDDRDPQRRLAAAEALAAAHLDDLRPALVKLLKDPDKNIRLRIARALAASGEKEAIPVLIELVAQLPADQSWAATEFLIELAGDKAPVLEGDKPEDPAARAKWKDAWAAWWKDHAADTDLGRLRADARPLLGYTLLCEVRGNDGRIAELGRDGKPRWQFNTNVSFPVDAQIVAGQHVLIAEYNGGRVTERDFTGKILWEKKELNQPVNAQRLPNGNTFIATRGQLLEVDRAGKEIINITRPGDVHAGGKTHDGKVICINDGGQCSVFDAKGNEIKTFSVQPISGFTSGLEVLPNNHLLIVQQSTQKIVEYDLTGKLLWEVKAPAGPISASRVRNGNTMVATQDGGAYEIDRTGKVVWEHKDECRTWRTRRR